jgi:hypothetical protein
MTVFAVFDQTFWRCSYPSIVYKTEFLWFFCLHSMRTKTIFLVIFQNLNFRDVTYSHIIFDIPKEGNYQSWLTCNRQRQYFILMFLILVLYWLILFDLLTPPCAHRCFRDICSSQITCIRYMYWKRCVYIYHISNFWLYTMYYHVWLNTMYYQEKEVYLREEMIKII